MKVLLMLSQILLPISLVLAKHDEGFHVPEFPLQHSNGLQVATDAMEKSSVTITNAILIENWGSYDLHNPETYTEEGWTQASASPWIQVAQGHVSVHRKNMDTAFGTKGVLCYSIGKIGRFCYGWSFPHSGATNTHRLEFTWDSPHKFFQRAFLKEDNISACDGRYRITATKSNAGRTVTKISIVKI